MIFHFDSYFSKGLKPPTSIVYLLLRLVSQLYCGRGPSGLWMLCSFAMPVLLHHVPQAAAPEYGWFRGCRNGALQIMGSHNCVLWRSPLGDPRVKPHHRDDQQWVVKEPKDPVKTLNFRCKVGPQKTSDKWDETGPPVSRINLHRRANPFKRHL